MCRVRDSQTVDALFTARDERSAVQDVRRKCVCDCDMLLGVRVDVVDILPVTVGLREALFSCFAELGHGLVEDIGSYPVVLADYLCAVERYFKSVRAGCVAGRRDEHAGRAVGIFGVYGHIVLNFNVVPLADGALRLNGCGHAGYPLPQVELMRALVEQDAAALAAPGCAPSAGIIICLRAVPVGDEPVEAMQLAVFAALHDFAQLDIHGICPLIEHQREHFVALRGDFVHFANLLCIDTCGLFAEHMDAVGQTVFDYRRVRIVRRCDYNSVDLARVNEGFGARYPVFCIRTGSAPGMPFT